MSFRVLNSIRVREGIFASSEKDGNNGVFEIKKITGEVIRCIVSEENGWEHVSVCYSNGKTPDASDMIFVKSIFWNDSDVVFQFYSGKDITSDNSKKALHLWRESNWNAKIPPTSMIGV